MPEIHPNDIGLATYDEVGDVAKLRTTAKTIVTAINELYQNGGSSSLGEQLYVDGENNIVIGENNIVYGSNNLVIGSDNIIVGENLNVVADATTKNASPNDEFSYDYFDPYSNTMWYWYWGEGIFEPPFKVGDKIAVNIYLSWCDEEWMDYVSTYSGLQIAEIVEVDEENYCFRIEGLDIDLSPPDDFHVIQEYVYPETLAVLNDEHLMKGSDGCLSFGGTATGTKSLAAGLSMALGSYSISAGAGRSEGSYCAAFGHGYAMKSGAFAGNYGRSYGDDSASFNNGYAYTPNSFAKGYYTRVVGRPLKATNLNTSSRYIVIDSDYSLSGIYEGTVLFLRCFNTSNSILFIEAKVKSVSGNTIYLADDTYLGSSGSYAFQLFPDGLIFVKDTSTSYANASSAGGYYSIASGKYISANGYHTIAAGEGSNIWGRYGTISEPYSLALANGTGHKAHSLAFKVLADGSVHADAEYTSPCADYAEYFEWEDGNPNAEDRTGYFVKLKGEKITKCDEFDKPLGIISAMPAIIGDSGEMHWKGKYITDEFGRIQYQDVIVPAEYDEEMNLIIEEHIERQPIINPNWNSSEEYIPRKDRPEWSPVGVLGKLIVYDDGTLQSGDICRPGPNGIAVKSIENGYNVLKRVSEDKVLIWFKE